MERNDWTPAVLITASVSLLTAGLVWIVAPWGPHGAYRGPGAERPRHALQPEVIVWTGEVAPGLKAVVAPVWGDEKPDRYHDESLNDDLGLAGAASLTYFRLLVFNTTGEPQVLRLDDGRLVMLAEEGGTRYPLRSLARMVADGRVHLDQGHTFLLRSLGALAETLEIPAGSYAQLVVPFDGGPHIERVRAVATSEGTPLRRRQMARVAFRRLIEAPDETRVKDL